MPLSTTTSFLLLILLFVPLSYSTVLNNTIIHEYAVSSCMSRRSLWKIITSCATTLFACAWTAIHPNMPGPVEGAVAIGFRRLGIMLLVLIAPEAILAWAIRQLFGAINVQKQFQKALQDGTLELRVKPHCEPSLVSAKVPYGPDEVRITIPEEKTEGLFEKLASLWSSIMAMFRRKSSHVHRKLGPSPVSLESLKSYYRWTLKHSFYAWMGGFVLIIDKDPALPREVYYPLTPEELPDFLERDKIHMSMVSEMDLDDRSKGDWLSKTVAVTQLVWFVIQLAARGFGKLPSTQLEIDSLAISVLGCFTYAFWWYKPKDVRCHVPVYWNEPGELPEIEYSVPQSVDDFLLKFGIKRNWIAHHIGEVYRPLLNLLGIYCVSDAAVKAHRVPSVCGYPPEVDRETFTKNLPVLIIGSLTGVVFGAIHCIAWNFTFPTSIEQMLWRVSSLVITVTPGLVLAVIACAYLVTDTIKIVPNPAVIMNSVGTVEFLYANSRLIVMVLTILSLRSLPAGVYDDVCWTSLLPHWY